MGAGWNGRRPRMGTGMRWCFGDFGCVRDFWIDVRKILNSGKLLAGDMALCSQNIANRQVTCKIFWNKELAPGSERRTSGVGAGWNWRRPRMRTVWRFLRARVKVTCHRNAVLSCGKLPLMK